MELPKVTTSEVKIKKLKVGRAGSRGLKISLPQVWCDDIGLVFGDSLEFYRDTSDRLIIVKAGVQ